MRIKSLAFLVAGVMLTPALGCSGGSGNSGIGSGTPLTQNTVSLPRTGQTTCYDEVGAQINCTGTGQDGALQTGVAWPVPRFTDNSDGTVIDNLTELVWLKNANCISTSYASYDSDGTGGDGRITWQHALDFIAGINAATYPDCGAGRTDWRLPNLKELNSLFDRATTNPALPAGYPFTNVAATGSYWSSTTYAANTAQAWAIATYYGSRMLSAKTVDVAVWPVRSGP